MRSRLVWTIGSPGDALGQGRHTKMYFGRQIWIAIASAIDVGLQEYRLAELIKERGATKIIPGIVGALADGVSKVIHRVVDLKECLIGAGTSKVVLSISRIQLEALAVIDDGFFGIALKYGRAGQRADVPAIRVLVELVDMAVVFGCGHCVAAQ